MLRRNNFHGKKNFIIYLMKPIRYYYHNYLSLTLCFWFLFFLFPERLFALDKKSYCSGVYNCLAEKPESCNDALCKKNPNIEYNSDFCEIFHRLKKRGLKPETFWGKRIYAYLSMEYRVTYTVDGTLPVSAPVMCYLMNNLPFSARLVNAYQGTGYTLEYTDTAKRKFRGDNGESLSGVFNIVLQDTNQLRNVYFGYGIAKVLMWNLRGTALVFFDYDPVDRSSVKYQLSCTVFPANSLIKSILNFVLFRKVVLSILKETIEHVQTSATEFYKGNLKPIEEYPEFNTPDGRKNIEAFQQIIQDSK